METVSVKVQKQKVQLVLAKGTVPVWLECRVRWRIPFQEMDEESLDMIIHGCILILTTSAVSDIKVVKPYVDIF